MAKPLKATFCVVGKDGTLGKPIPVKFNPTEYTLNKGAQITEVTIPGLDSPILQFVRGQTETLSLDLFFDSTDNGMDDDATPVTKQTDQFYQLVKIAGSTHAPPVCYFSWGSDFPGQLVSSPAAGGSQQRHGFKCLIESVRQRFTLFSPQGVPLRATLTVSLKEYKTLSDQISELNLRSDDHTQTHVVQTGETLSQIAYLMYDDPTQWRYIADQNSILDPLQLTPGTVLQIPMISSSS